MLLALYMAEAALGILVAEVAAFVVMLGMNRGTTLPDVEGKSFCLAYTAALGLAVGATALASTVRGDIAADSFVTALLISCAMLGIASGLIGHLWHEWMESRHGTRLRAADMGLPIYSSPHEQRKARALAVTIERL